MRVLITGVAGFIGSTIAEKHLLQGDEVTGIDMMTDYYDTNIKRSNLSGILPRMADFYEDDALSFSLESILKSVDVVYHQAGQPGVRKSWGADFQHYTKNNVMLTQHLLEQMKKTDSKSKFVYASSSSVYGDAETFPTTEEALPGPLSPYGVSKLAAEHLCRLYAKNYGVRTVSLRYFTVYGPKQRPDMAFNAFIKSILSGEPVRVFGTGDQLRDFTYVDDIVAANMAAGTIDIAPGSTLNIAGGSNVSVNEVLGILQQISGIDFTVERSEKIAGDVFRTGGSTAEAVKRLAWEPKTSLAEGLEKQYQWMHNRMLATQ